MTPEELETNGLLWLVNRTLHPFGYAVAVTQWLDDKGDPLGYDKTLAAYRVDDPHGLMFSPDSEEDGRTKFLRWLSEDVERRLDLIDDGGGDDA